MPVNEKLLTLLRAQLTKVVAIEGSDSLEERRIIGGTGLFWHGHLVCGVTAADMLVRIAKTDGETHIGDDDSRPMVMAGRQSKSWVIVPEASAGDEAVMAKWVALAVSYVRTLPRK